VLASGAPRRVPQQPRPPYPSPAPRSRDTWSAGSWRGRPTTLPSPRSTRWLGDGLLASLDRLGEDVLEPAQATATTDAYVTLFRPARRRGTRGSGGGVDQAVGDRSGAGSVDGDRQTPARSARPAAAVGSTVTVDMEDHTTTDLTLGTIRELRDDFPWVGAVLQGLPPPYRVRLRRPGRLRQSRTTVQGRLQGAEFRCVPGHPRGRPFLCPLPQGADGRRGLPDGGHPRPATGRDRWGAGGALAAWSGELRVPDVVRHSVRRNRSGWLPVAPRSASTCRTARTGTPTSCGVGGASGQPAVLPQIGGDQVMTESTGSQGRIAVLGAGKMGEALLSGLAALRALGRRPDRHRPPARAGQPTLPTATASRCSTTSPPPRPLPR